MKIHEGRCSDHALCTRTHGYKCRACSIWFQTSNETFIDLGKTIFTFPFWPYCSRSCWVSSAIACDPGMPRDVRVTFTSDEWGTFLLEYPNPQAHQEFNDIMATMKEL